MLIQNLPGCLTGTLLVASPALTEAGFRRSVVFLFAHSPDGAMGLIVNRALRTGSALRHLRDSGVDNWLLARGHAAWAPGQLEQELNEGAWLTAPALDWTIFRCDDNLKWPAALRGLGIAPEGLSAQMGRA